MSSRKWKLKQKWDTTIHLLEWPKSATLTTSNAGKGTEQQELSLLVGIQNGTATLEDSLAAAYKTKHILAITSGNHAAWNLSKGDENLHSHSNLHIDFFSSFIHNCQNLEATKISFRRWMDKQTSVHPDNGILLSTWRKWVIKPWKDIEEM